MSTPTLTEFLARFPEFGEASSDLMQLYLDDAEAAVGESWVSSDIILARMYLAAHLLAASGHGLGASAAKVLSGNLTGGVKSRKVGDVSTEFWGAANAAGASRYAGSQYATTAYGQRYLDLMRVSFPAVLAV